MLTGRRQTTQHLYGMRRRQSDEEKLETLFFFFFFCFCKVVFKFERVKEIHSLQKNYIKYIFD